MDQCEQSKTGQLVAALTKEYTKKGSCALRPADSHAGSISRPMHTRPYRGEGCVINMYQYPQPAMCIWSCAKFYRTSPCLIKVHILSKCKWFSVLPSFGDLRHSHSITCPFNFPKMKFFSESQDLLPRDSDRDSDSGSSHEPRYRRSLPGSHALSLGLLIALLVSALYSIRLSTELENEKNRPDHCRSNYSTMNYSVLPDGSYLSLLTCASWSCL